MLKIYAKIRPLKKKSWLASLSMAKLEGGGEGFFFFLNFIIVYMPLYGKCCITKTCSIDRFHSRDRWPQWGGETIRNI